MEALLGLWCWSVTRVPLWYPQRIFIRSLCMQLTAVVRSLTGLCRQVVDTSDASRCQPRINAAVGRLL